MRRGARAIALLLAVVACGRASANEPIEPPPDAPAGDWEVERADSLDDGTLEVDLAAAGARGEAPRRARRVRFRGGGTGGALRDGDDPLAGGDLETHAAGGRLRFGRLAPRWGRGLLLGGAADPWSPAADDRGEDAPFRGRAGDGAAWRAGTRGEVVAGRFSKRSLMGARASAGALGVGWLGGRAHRPQASLSIAGDGPSIEYAGDSRGRWRAEFAHEAPLADAAAVSLRLRAGHAEFRSLAEPRRAGPPRAATLTLVTFSGGTRVAVHGALWSFGPGASGARGALVFGAPLFEHAALDAGFEEQRGPRLPTDRTRGLRQGFWSELRAGREGTSVALRHELWGEQAFARAAVRRALAVRVERAGPAGSTVAVSHWAWSARSGESLWLPEADGARLALRVLRGVGERTRIEMSAPVPGGRARAAIVLSRAAGESRDVRWTAEWSRRGRL